MRRTIKSFLLVTLSLSLILSVALTVHSSSAFAYSTTVSPFPIGIFWPPGPSDTTDANYANIQNMNANFIVASNGLNDFATNDAALTKAASHGLKMLVNDERIMYTKTQISQTTMGSGYFVNSSNNLGQTFTLPAGTDWELRSIQLYIDKNNWPSGIKLTLSLYDSPSKTKLLSSSSITGPVTTFYPVFSLSGFYQGNKSYYMELTSNSSTNVGWVVTSAADSYPGGQMYRNGATGTPDLYFNMALAKLVYNDGGQPNVSDLQNIAQHYSLNTAVLGYNVYDEPSAPMMQRIKNTSNVLNTYDPNHMTFVNLLPTYASASQMGVDNKYDGNYVKPGSPLGQTFKTKPGQTSIQTIQLYIDPNQWSSTEPLTLSLWNSPAKTTLLASTTLNGSSTAWPQFTLNVAVNGNTQYYWELTHGGGGDNSVGWVVRSNTGDDWFDGTAYVGGSAINADFWFTVNQNIQFGTYEDYVYRHLTTNPDVLIFDHYPFSENGSVNGGFYQNLETIRKQALLGKVDFWSYIQSVGISGSLRSPNQNEMRYDIYAKLVYGAKGIIYFTYTLPNSPDFHDALASANGTPTASYTWAQNINSEVLNLGSTLTGLTSLGVYHSGTLPAGSSPIPSTFFVQPAVNTQPVIEGYFTNASGRKYVMLMNRDYVNSKTLDFNFNPKPQELTEISKTTGLEVSVLGYNTITGVLNLTLLPGEGRLFALPAGY